MSQPAQPYPSYQTPPPPAKAKTRTWLWILAVVVALAIGYGAGSTQGSSSTTAKPSGTPAAPATSEKGEPEPGKPAGEVKGFCDYTLSETINGANTFDASLEAINSGNVDVKMDVWAEFDQVGHKPVRLVKKGVKVPVGESVEVHLSEEASTTQISRHQSADSQCDLGGEIR